MQTIAAINIPTDVTQVKFNKTILGFFNIRIAGGNDNTFVNLSPVEFRELFPNVSNKAKYGCGSISTEKARELFNSKKVVSLV